MGGGGGGDIDTSALMRHPSQEWKNIRNWYAHQTDQYNQFIGQDPILSHLYQGAADYFNQGPSDMLQALQKQGLDYLQGGPSDVTKALTSLGLSAATAGPSALTTAMEKFGLNQLQGGPSQLLQDVIGGARGLQEFGMNQLEAGPSDLLRLMQGQAQEDLANRGALTPALNRDVRNETLAAAGAMGMGHTPGTLGTELLNREKYREQREQLARQYATGTEQLSEADLANRFGIATGGQQALAQAQGLSAAELAQQFGFARGAQQAGIEDLSSRLAAGQIGQGAEIQDIASRFGIGGQVQGLTQADIAQRFAIPLSVLGGATSSFSNLTNPILAYLGNLFSGNQQTGLQGQIANSQAGASNKAGQSGLIGSGIGAIGSIAGAVIL